MEGLKERRLYLVRQVQELEAKSRELKVALRKLLAQRRYKNDYSIEMNRALRDLSDRSDEVFEQKLKVQRELGDIKLKITQENVSRFTPNSHRAITRQLCGDNGEIFARKFVDVARLVLTGEVFEAIKTKTLEQLEQEQQRAAE